MVKWRYISCAGGAHKGILYIGAIRALHDHFERYHKISFATFCREHVRGFAGTSVGSLVALAFMLNIAADDVMETFAPLLSDLMSNTDVTKMFTKFGVDSGEMIKLTTRRMLSRAGLAEDTTMGKLESLLRAEFVCVTTNLSRQQVVYLTGKSHPALSVVDAVYMSACIPFVFVPVELDGEMFVDGGFCDNIPRFFPRDETLHFKFDRPTHKGPTCVQTISEFAQSIYSVCTAKQEQEDDAYYRECDGDVIKLGVSNAVGNEVSFNVYVNARDIQQRISLGYASALGFLEPSFTQTLHLMILFVLETYVQSQCKMPSPIEASCCADGQCT